MELTQEQQRVLKLAKEGHNLIFTGQCGTGKMHLLRCLFIYKFGYSNLTFKCRIQGRSSISIYQFASSPTRILPGLIMNNTTGVLWETKTKTLGSLPFCVAHRFSSQCCIYSFLCLRSVSFAQCCICLWIVHSWLSLRFSLV